ncbi:MAG: hypothetical protein ACE5G0_09470 [Rhodothermales bacterium]
MKPSAQAQRCLTPFPLAWGIIIAFLTPFPCWGQHDSTAVVVLRERIERLEKAVAGCEEQATEFARLLAFTERFPHRYRQAEVQVFRQRLVELSGCLATVQQTFEEVSRDMPEKPAAPPEREAERRRATGDAEIAALHEKLDGLEHRKKDLATISQQVEAQLKRLIDKLPPDSTGYKGQA